MHAYKETTCALYTLLLSRVHSVMYIARRDGDGIHSAASELQPG